MNVSYVLKKSTICCFLAFFIFFNAMPLDSVNSTNEIIASHHDMTSTIKKLEKFLKYFKKEISDSSLFGVEIHDRKLITSLEFKFAGLLQFPLDVFLNFESSFEKIKVKRLLKNKETKVIVDLLSKILKLQKKVNEKIETFLLLEGRKLGLQQIQSIKLRSFYFLCEKAINSNKLKDPNSLVLKTVKSNLPRFSKYKKLLKIGLGGICKDICAKYLKFITTYRNNKLELQNVSEEELDSLLLLITAKLNFLLNEKKSINFKSKIFNHINNNKLKIKILLCKYLIDYLIDIKNELILFQKVKQQYDDLDIKKQKIFIKCNSLIKNELFIKLKNEQHLKSFFCKFLEIVNWYFSNDFDVVVFKLKVDELSDELELLKINNGSLFPNYPILDLILQYFGIGGDKEFYFIIKKMILILNNIYLDEIGDDGSFWNLNIVKTIGNKVLNKMINPEELPNNFLF